LTANLGLKRREKVFGEGRLVPLDRNAKVRIITLARALTRRTEPDKHYGVLTAKFVAVLDALLWAFHNAASGRCYPSYERIAERADCARSTVYEAIHALEDCGILTWVNRIVRIREWGPDLFGRAQNRWRVIRTSNAYAFIDPASKSDLATETANQELILSVRRGRRAVAKRSAENPVAISGPPSAPDGAGPRLFADFDAALAYRRQLLEAKTP
jgi:helix-turn-helix protein